MTKHDESKRERRSSPVFAPESQRQADMTSSPRRPSTRIEPQEARLEDFGSDYPTPPPEASGEDF